MRPGLRVPLTANAELFADAVAIGRIVVWLHSYGERCVDVAAGRPHAPPRLVGADKPEYSAAGTIPSDRDHMPDTMTYDELRALALCDDSTDVARIDFAIKRSNRFRSSACSTSRNGID